MVTVGRRQSIQKSGISTQQRVCSKLRQLFRDNRQVILVPSFERKYFSSTPLRATAVMLNIHHCPQQNRHISGCVRRLASVHHSSRAVFQPTTLGSSFLSALNSRFWMSTAGAEISADSRYRMEFSTETLETLCGVISRQICRFYVGKSERFNSSFHHSS